MPRGALIVFEGAEGVGKTTQIGLLVARMHATGVPHLSLREPGGTPLGDEIRRLLLDPGQRIVPRAEALLFMASRAQLVDDVVVPAIREGQFVLTDRFFLSTYAYQIAGRGLDEAAIRMANQFATAGVIPDLTLLLDLPDGAGMVRAASLPAFLSASPFRVPSSTPSGVGPNASGGTRFGLLAMSSASRLFHLARSS